MATQAQRRLSTRTRLLEAATACLVESGYTELTTTAVAKRAGLSQGALFRYFPSKQALLGATAEHLFGTLRSLYEVRFGAAMRKRAVTLVGALELLAEVLQDPRYLAALELHTAARTDLVLRESLDPVVHRHAEDLRRLARALPIERSVTGRISLDDAVDLATLALQGAAVHRLAVRDTTAFDRAVGALTRLALPVSPALPAPVPPVARRSSARPKPVRRAKGSR
ncbi:MAG: TetR/AcrR family transcriptional regulator [Deltaproteobacteria bacterium]|nr:TetR/AcrR family transcriptional regulator [Deltaproteobacteria bacterium]